MHSSGGFDFQLIRRDIWHFVRNIKMNISLLPKNISFKDIVYIITLKFMLSIEIGKLLLSKYNDIDNSLYWLIRLYQSTS